MSPFEARPGTAALTKGDPTMAPRTTLSLVLSMALLTACTSETDCDESDTAADCDKADGDGGDDGSKDPDGDGLTND